MQLIQEYKNDNVIVRAYDTVECNDYNYAVAVSNPLNNIDSTFAYFVTVKEMFTFYDFAVSYYK